MLTTDRGWRQCLAKVVGALLGAALFMMSDGSPAVAQKKLNVVATTGMIADAVKQVGGDRVQVKALMGPGVDPHTYRQTRSDIVAMTKADAVFWHGLYLEAQLEDFLRDLAKRKPVVALAEALPKDKLLGSDDYPGRRDPHVWMDPRLWKGVVEAARDQLIRLDPGGEAIFKASAARHLAEIDALATYADKAFASVPEASRVLITAHDAFKYFGRAYGYEVLGIQGISTESEAGLKQIEHLVDVIVTRKIRAIFVESSVSDRNVKALIEGAAAKDHKVVIGGELFSDAMGAPGTYEGTYIGMMDHNATVITRALGGEAPAKGLNNRLAGT
ncbi:MAG: metal ABC transporter solute-binding protein, Zn/Mn family [Hyphomicrobiaceae bacterium]